MLKLRILGFCDKVLAEKERNKRWQEVEEIKEYLRKL